jgi:hypothetical protein
VKTSCVWLLAALSLGACKGEDAPKAEDTKDGKGAATAASADSTGGTEPAKASGAAPAKGTAQPGGPGPAYLAVKDSGVVMIDGGAVKMVQPLEYTVHGLSIASDGSVWVAAIEGVYRIERDRATEVNKDGVNVVAPVSAREAWSLSHDVVGHYDGGSWSKEDKAIVGVTGLLKDIAVTDDGTVYVASSDSLHRKKKGGAWEKVDLSKQTGGKDPFFDRLARGPGDSLYLSYMHGVLMKSGDGWQPLGADFGIGASGSIAVATQGRVAAVKGLSELVVVEPGGEQRTVQPGSAGIKAKRFHSVAHDDSGRMWIATDNGLAVLDATGKLARQYEPGTLAGVEGAVEHVLVVGAGPADLPAAGAAETGTVTGKVTKNDSAITSARVEICASPSMMFRSTPCEDASFKKETTTDASGVFKIADVPIGSYGFAVMEGGKWTITLGGDCCAKMKKGQEFDAGTIKLDK